MQLIYDFLTQLVFQKNGVDYEFNQKVFDWNLEPILEGLVNQTLVDQVNMRLEALELKCAEEVTAKTELEAKLSVANKTLEVVKKEAQAELILHCENVTKLEETIKALRAEITRVSSLQRGSTTSIPVAEVSVPESAAPPPPPPPPPGAPPPPPPPGAPPAPGAPPSASAVPKKKKYTKDKPTKRLNWNQIPYSRLDKECFWLKIDESQFEKSELFERIIDCFCTKTRAPAASVVQPEANFAKKKSKDPVVLDGKTIQNLSIFLGGCKLPYDEIVLKLYQFDELFVTETFVDNLNKLLPSAEMRTMLQEYDGDLEELPEAEVFVRKLSPISNLELRLSFMLMRARFKEQLDDIKPQLAFILSGLQEVLASEKLAGVLQLVLLSGNFMNVGSRVEGTFAFDLTFLSKLADTKTQAGTSFMHFLAEMIETHYPHLSGFDKELSSVHSAVKVAEDAVTKNVVQIAKNVEQIESNLPKFDPPDNKDDRFAPIMKEFLNLAAEQMVILQEMLDRGKEQFLKLQSFFALPDKIHMDEFFGLFHKLVDDYNRAYIDNKRRAEKEERERIAKERKEQSALAKEQKKKEGPVFGGQTSKEGSKRGKDGMMDELFQALESGQAFQKPKASNVVLRKNRPAPDAVLSERRRTMNLNARDAMSQMLKANKDLIKEQGNEEVI